MSLPTFEEWTKNMSLTDQLKFHYDVDLDNFTGDVWEILSDALTNPNWLNKFNKEFEENDSRGWRYSISFNFIQRRKPEAPEPKRRKGHDSGGGIFKEDLEK